MALPMVESLLGQAREVSQEDIDRLCAGILDTYALPDKNVECMKLLRYLFLTLQMSDTKPNLPKKLLSKLFASVVLSKKSSRECLLCKQIFRELLPTDDDDKLEILSDYTTESSYLPLYLSQGQKFGCLAKMASECVRWLSHSGDFELQRKVFCFIVAVMSLHSQVLNQDQIAEVNNYLPSWLMKTSCYQAPNRRSLNPFRKDEINVVSEIDGTPSRNFFTVLNIAQYNTDDQFLNIFTFSMLYQWLYHSSRRVLEEVSLENFMDVEQNRQSGSCSPMVPVVFSMLIGRVIDYSFRVLDQCERKPKVSSDAELQNACLIETISILDVVCKLDKEQTPKVFQEVKRVFTRMSQENGHPRILLQLLQFFINHSATVVHDPQLAYDLYFNIVLGKNFHDPAIAFDTVFFLQNNLEPVCYKSNILSKFFPNILKILAWHPHTFAADFLKILPAMITPSTALEVFHRLLELPCLTAVLEVALKEKRVDSIPPSPSDIESQVIFAFQNDFYKPLFSFITSNDSGHGDTINRLDDLHDVLQSVKQHTRVVVCAQAVPKLLNTYFSVVLEDGDEEFGFCLIPVLMERVGLLYDILDFKNNIRRMFAENLVCLLKKYPQIVVRQPEEIMDYLMSTQSINDGCFFMHLIWGVGEFCSSSHDATCSAKLISRYYEVLESLMYELSGLMQTSERQETEFRPRLLSILMSSISKLASRCQDMVPRVVLCLTKVNHQFVVSDLEEETKEILLNRAQELINILSFPNFSSTILNPPLEIESGEWHQDSMCLPVILRTAHRLLQANLPR